MIRWLILSVFLTLHSMRAKPSEEVIKADQRRLDRLTVIFGTTPQFGGEYYLACKQLAAYRGAEILHALMERSEKWVNEDGLIYVPLVALLPRTETLALLREYQKSSVEFERVYAREYLIELASSDVGAMVLLFRGVRWYPGLPAWGDNVDYSEYLPPVGSGL